MDLCSTKLAHPSKVPDPAAPYLEPISYLYSLMRIHHRSLDTILQDSIFSHAGLAGLNDHSALSVVSEVAAVLADRGEMEALAEVEQVRHRLTLKMRHQEPLEETIEARQDVPPMETTREADQPYIDPLAGVDELKPARRSEAEDVPFRLESLMGNLDTITGQRLPFKDPYTRQDLLEESAYDAARWQSMHEADQLNKLGLGTDIRLKGNQLQQYMSEWLEALVPHLEKQIQDKEEPLRLSNISIGDEDVMALLSLMEVRKLAFITIVDILRTVGNTMTDGVKATRAIIVLGRTIEDEFGAEAWKLLHPDLYDRAIKSDFRQPQLAIRKFMVEQGMAAGAANLARQEGYGDEADELMHIEDTAEKAMKLKARERAMPWTQKMRAKVGGFLIKALLDVATVQRVTRLETGERVTEKQPAFHQSYQFHRGKKIGVLKLNSVVSSRLDKDTMGHAIFPRYLPMLVVPKAWKSWNSGGYRIHPTEIMRMQDSPEQMQHLKLASEQGHLDQIFAALDVLGGTAWRINKPIFDVVSQVWNSGEALADIPLDNAESSIPDPIMPPDADVKDPKLKEAYRVHLKNIRNARAKAHSQRCDLNYKLEIARAVRSVCLRLDFYARASVYPG